MGITVRYRKDHGMIYSYLEYPIKNRDDWVRMKNAFDPSDPKRYPANWGTDLINHYNQRITQLDLHYIHFSSV